MFLSWTQLYVTGHNLFLWQANWHNSLKVVTELWSRTIPFSSINLNDWMACCMSCSGDPLQYPRWSLFDYVCGLWLATTFLRFDGFLSLPLISVSPKYELFNLGLALAIDGVCDKWFCWLWCCDRMHKSFLICLQKVSGGAVFLWPNLPQQWPLPLTSYCLASLNPAHPGACKQIDLAETACSLLFFGSLEIDQISRTLSLTCQLCSRQRCGQHLRNMSLLPT